MTEKQWGRPCSELPAHIIKRLPLRFTFDNNYFNDRYQGIPIGGYTKMAEAMFSGCEIRLNCDYLANRKQLEHLADKVIYTGTIDGFFDYSLGKLEYRSLRFETKKIPGSNVQGVAVLNYTSADTPCTRSIEHKHFEPENQKGFNASYSFVSYEYPAGWQPGDEPYYSVNDQANTQLYQKYAELAAGEKNVVFGGRLGMYRYFDMDDTVIAAMKCFKQQVNI